MPITALASEVAAGLGRSGTASDCPKPVPDVLPPHAASNGRKSAKAKPAWREDGRRMENSPGE